LKTSGKPSNVVNTYDRKPAQRGRVKKKTTLSIERKQNLGGRSHQRKLYAEDRGNPLGRRGFWCVRIT